MTRLPLRARACAREGSCAPGREDTYLRSPRCRMACAPGCESAYCRETSRSMASVVRRDACSRCGRHGTRCPITPSAASRLLRPHPHLSRACLLPTAYSLHASMPGNKCSMAACASTCVPGRSLLRQVSRPPILRMRLPPAAQFVRMHARMARRRVQQRPGSRSVEMRRPASAVPATPPPTHNTRGKRTHKTRETATNGNARDSRLYTNAKRLAQHLNTCPPVSRHLTRRPRMLHTRNAFCQCLCAGGGQQCN